MEFNCVVCFELIPEQKPVIGESSNGNYILYLSKLFNLPSFDNLFGNIKSISTSCCLNCSNNIEEISKKLKNIEDLELEIKELKSQFEKNLIFGYKKSLEEENKQMDMGRKDFRAQLIEDLGLAVIPQLFDFCDFDQDYKENLGLNDSEPEPASGYVSVPVPVLDKILIISLEKLNLPDGRISFNLSELKKKSQNLKSLKRRKSKINLNRRKKFEMNFEDFISCSYEGCVFRSRHQKTLNSHVERMHLKLTYNCSICSNFSSNHRLTVVRHERKEHPESLVKQFTCDNCGHRSVTEYDLKCHMSTHDESAKIFKCEICFKGFVTQGRLNSHQKTHQEHNCPCPFCGISVWRNELVFKKHVKTHQENLKCSKCKEIFKTLTGLKYHILRCEKKFGFKCSQCTKQYVTRNELKTHVKRSHEMAMPYVCNFCQKPYKYKDYLNVHIRTVHTGEKPYQCTICENAYASRHSFKIHKLTHNKNPEGLKHFCDFCEKKFLSNGYLQQHLTKTQLCQAKEKERIASLVL